LSSARTVARAAVDSNTCIGQFRVVRAFMSIVFIALLAAHAAGCHRDACLPTCVKRAKELACNNPQDCKASCDKLHGSPICVSEFKAFEACFLKEPREHWQCDVDGQPAVKEGVCSPERAKVMTCLETHPLPVPAPAPAKKP
jgi:hypothetical protein